MSHDRWTSLQEIVDALSVRLGRPVLVDDVDLRPLAYSIQFGELDSVRTASILGRTAPDAARDALFGHGIRTATEPVRIPPTRRSGWRRASASRSCAAAAGSASCG